MANPNPEIWGNNDTWIYSDLSYGIQSTAAIENGFCKPFVAEFDNTATTGYKGSLYKAISAADKITANTPLDRSISPCGQDPYISPWGTIAIFNENSDISTTPSRIVTTTTPINWFFCDRMGIQNNARYYSKVYNHNNELGLAFQQFSPNCYTPVTTLNTTLRLSPYVYYGTRSFVLTIQVHLAPKNASEVIVDTLWANLDNWVNYKDTHDLIGIRLFARNCLSYNNITDILTYNTDTAQTGGQNSNQIAVIQDFVVDNNGTEVKTEFLSLNMQKGVSDRSGYIFDPVDVENYPSTDYRRTNGVLPCWNYFDGQQIKRWKSSDNTDATFWYTIPYSQANYDKIMKIAALFGCYFTPTSKNEFNYNMLDSDLYLPIIDNNGIAHGDYTRGTDNTNNSLYDKTSIREIDYNPDKPFDPNTYSNVTGFNTITNNAALTKFYVLDSANVEKLGDDLWTICDGLSAGDFEHFDGKIKDEFLTTNPIDSIIALKRFPFNIPHTFNPNKVSVQLGKSTGTAQGYRTYEILFGVNFKGVDIFPRFGDCFLDYSPYTKYELYIPFCGTVEINAGDVLGHKLNCQLLIDLLTGSCMTYIMADQLVIGTAKGSCGVDMQMSGAQTATMNANIFNGILNAQLAETQHITSIGKISLNPFKWYENIEVAETRQLQTQHDITHMVVPLHKMGSASPLLSWVQEFNARLMIYYPEGDVITSTIPPDLNAAAVESFGHIKGFATATPGKVSSFQRIGKQCYLSGNIVADSIPCTDNERQRIIAAFNSGVYLPSL